MPIAGQRYLFFLKQENPDDPFHIVTAYELRENRVFPLDELPQFSTHKGENQSVLMDALRNFLTK